MKKKIALMLGLVLTVSALAGCTNKKPAEQAAANGGADKQTQTEAQTESADETEDAAAGATAPADGGLMTGYAMSTTIADSTDAAADAEGAAKADTTIAAVTVDAEGKIVSCVIDSVQSTINFGTDGKLTTDVAARFATKNELGTDYGMSKASSIGKDWHEQASAFAEYCVGKTVEEVTGIALNEQGTPAEEDLAAGCTIHIGAYQALVAKAVENADWIGAQAGDKLGLGVFTHMSKSTDATADADGLAQAYTTISVNTVNAEGVITSAVIDAVQADVNFDVTGKITTDLAAAVPSKNEIGADYGMAAASSIGKEWDQQASAYAAYALGKTVDEVNGTAVDAGVPSDADLAASVTIHITDFNTVITKAVDNAK